MKKIEIFGRTVLSCVLTFLVAVLYWPIVIMVNIITLPAQIVILIIFDKKLSVEIPKYDIDHDSVADYVEKLSYKTDDKFVAFESSVIADVLNNTNKDGEPSVLKCVLWNMVKVYGNLLNHIWEW